MVEIGANFPSHPTHKPQHQFNHLWVCPITCKSQQTIITILLTGLYHHHPLGSGKRIDSINQFPGISTFECRGLDESAGSVSAPLDLFLLQEGAPATGSSSSRSSMGFFEKLQRQVDKTLQKVRWNWGHQADVELGETGWFVGRQHRGGSGGQI